MRLGWIRTAIVASCACAAVRSLASSAWSIPAAGSTTAAFLPVSAAASSPRVLSQLGFLDTLSLCPFRSSETGIAFLKFSFSLKSGIIILEVDQHVRGYIVWHEPEGFGRSNPASQESGVELGTLYS